MTYPIDKDVTRLILSFAFPEEDSNLNIEMPGDLPPFLQRAEDTYAVLLVWIVLELADYSYWDETRNLQSACALHVWWRISSLCSFQLTYYRPNGVAFIL
jgi:hypothetical protein